MSDHRPAPSTTFFILAAAAAGMGALLAYLPAAGHDQLWLLYVARHVLHGSQLYGPELFESNPPLSVWLSMLPVILGQALHLPDVAVGKALIVLLQIATAGVCLPLLRRLLPDVTRNQIAALLFVFIAVFDVVPARDLGQREHVLTLLCLPYLLLAALRAARQIRPAAAICAAAGLAAGIGLALKPHQAILPVAVELYLILRTRSARTLLRPEPFVIVGVAAAYFVAIHRLTPLYLTDVLPLLRDTYWAVGSLSLLQLLWEAVEMHILGFVAIFLYLRDRTAGPSTVPQEVFLVAGCASTLAYYVQGTGWYYQQLPAISFFALALCLQLLPMADRRFPSWSPRAAMGLSVLALGLTMHFMNYPFTRERSFPIEHPDPAFFADLPPGTAVATLTTTVDYTVMPAARYDLVIAQRYPHLWMLPAILRNEVPDVGHPTSHVIAPTRLAQLDQMQHDFMTEDLKHWKPELVLIERCHKAAVHCQLIEDRDDDLLAWFLRDPGFAAEWKNYSYAGHHLLFDAYIRQGSGISIH